MFPEIFYEQGYQAGLMQSDRILLGQTESGLFIVPLRF